MISLSFRVLLGSLAFLAAACGGGGGSSIPNGTNLSCDPGDYRPIPPAGLGVAGVMDGHWRVVDQQLVADPRLRDPDLEQTWLAMDGEIEFRDGRVYEGEVPNGGEPTQQPNQPQTQATPEFYCNEQASGLTLYGFGVRFTSQGGSGATRVCGIFGTTSATAAIGVLVEELLLSIPGIPGVDRFTVHRVTLERFTP